MKAEIITPLAGLRRRAAEMNKDSDTRERVRREFHEAVQEYLAARRRNRLANARPERNKLPAKTVEVVDPIVAQYQALPEGSKARYEFAAKNYATLRAAMKKAGGVL